MSQSLTLAHISDLHLTPIVGLGFRHWNVKRGLGYINWARNRRLVHLRPVADILAADIQASVADHVAVTGDLANLGLPGEFGPARDWLVALGTPDFVSAVPGNHDIYSRRMFGASCLEAWGAYLSSDAWGAALTGAGSGAGTGAGDGPAFPFVRRIGGFALIGLNSAIPTRPFEAAGRLGRAQRAALDRLLEICAARAVPSIVLIHHPPLPGQTAPRRALQDAEELAAILSARGADLVLHGHNHRDSLVWHPGPRGPIPIVGVASGSAVREHGPEPLARYNLYRLSPGGHEPIEMTVRGLGGEGGDVIELSRTHLNPPR